MRRDDLDVTDEALSGVVTTTPQTRNRIQRKRRDFFRWKVIEEHEVGIDCLQGTVVLRVYDCVHRMRPDWRAQLLRTDDVHNEDGSVRCVPVYTGIVDVDGVRLEFVDLDALVSAMAGVQARLLLAQEAWDAMPKRDQRPARVRPIRLVERNVVSTSSEALKQRPLGTLEGVRVIHGPGNPPPRFTEEQLADGLAFLKALQS